MATSVASAKKEALRETRSTQLKKKSLPLPTTPKQGNKESAKAEDRPRVGDAPSTSKKKRTPDTPPLNCDMKALVEAPVFHPSEKEFNDPIEYLEKIRPKCEPYGICRIVPPATFKPECQVSDAMRFTAYNQYVHRMFRRKGPNSRHLNAIQRHLTALDIDCHPPPCIGGIEVDLCSLYQAVQDLGGPSKVLENNLWPKVGDMLKVTLETLFLYVNIFVYILIFYVSIFVLHLCFNLN